ncbi:MAG: hypothetical protein HQ567_04175 [Candidatus Nealsonbacteria bacterium]|nr:hypothetical protein [Candidatus Nealsonbacteria bacterium]
MMRRQTYMAIIVSAMVIAGIGIFATESQAQETLQETGWVWHPGSVHYHRIHQTSSWRWAPDLGWYRHDYYVQVPHRTPGHWVYYRSGQLTKIVYLDDDRYTILPR